jgi:hypothetical protein
VFLKLVPKHSSSAMYPTSLRSLEGFLLFALLLPPSIATHHMQLPPVHWVNKRDSSVPLKVTNRCDGDIYPGIQTQGGTAPPSSGFLLKPGASNSQMVSADWNGRVWARTNCSFNAQGTASANGAGPACDTGDCGGAVACPSTVSTRRDLYSSCNTNSTFSNRVNCQQHWQSSISWPRLKIATTPFTTSPSLMATTSRWQLST